MLEKINLDQLSKKISKIKSDTILIIADQNVWNMYSKKLDILKLERKKVFLWKAPAGETVKNINDYISCIEFFLEKGVNRNSHLIAIGGGATTDFAGFVASTLLRGIKWSAVPTTLLAMIDASIGGKVGINSKEYKNQIGAFHLPEKTYIDTDFLDTLPEIEKKSGLGEMIKYGFLSEEIFNEINQQKKLSDIIFKCAEYKYQLTQRDLKESGERKILNLGHSLGHGLEKIYELPHGISVFWGMALIFYLFDNSSEALKKLEQMYKALEVDFGEAPWFKRTFPVAKMVKMISKDKKKMTNETIDLILFDSKKSIIIETVTIEKIESLLDEKKDEIKKFNI